MAEDRTTIIVDDVFVPGTATNCKARSNLLLANKDYVKAINNTVTVHISFVDIGGFRIISDGFKHVDEFILTLDGAVVLDQGILVVITIAKLARVIGERTFFKACVDGSNRIQIAIGDDAQDGNRLLGSVGDSRETAIDTALADLAQFLATVIAHECGHSVGLVVNGAMPTGLYGDDATNFPGSLDSHIRNTSLFPTGSTNVMSPSLNFTLATDPSSAFNTLNMAYLREQVFYN